MTGSSGSLSCGAREVKSPCEWQGGTRHCSRERLSLKLSPLFPTGPSLSSPPQGPRAGDRGAMRTECAAPTEQPLRTGPAHSHPPPCTPAETTIETLLTHFSSSPTHKPQRLNHKAAGGSKVREGREGCRRGPRKWAFCRPGQPAAVCCHNPGGDGLEKYRPPRSYLWAALPLSSSSNADV